jgi:hypothetical protein
VDVGVVLVPIIGLVGARRVAGADLQHDVRDVAGRDVGIVPFLRYRTWVGLVVVNEDNEAAAYLQPGRIRRVVRLQIQKVAGNF